MVLTDYYRRFHICWLYFTLSKRLPCGVIYCFHIEWLDGSRYLKGSLKQTQIREKHIHSTNYISDVLFRTDNVFLTLSNLSVSLFNNSSFQLQLERVKAKSTQVWKEILISKVIFKIVVEFRENRIRRKRKLSKKITILPNSIFGRFRMRRISFSPSSPNTHF